MKIALGSDHGGFAIKEAVLKHLKEKGYECIDVGCYNLDSVHYPKFGIEVAELVSRKEVDFGVVVCTTGIGISISANKVKGVRCALCFNEKVAKMTRLHNNSNVIALPGAYVSEKEAITFVDTFLTSEFEGGRHELRVKMIEEYENTH